MCQPWAIQNGLIYSKPGNPIFLRVINRIAAYRNRVIMVSLHCVQRGPNCFGMEVAAEESSMNIVKGIFQPLTPTLSFNNLMYVAQSWSVNCSASHLLDDRVSRRRLFGHPAAWGEQLQAALGERQIYR